MLALAMHGCTNARWAAVDLRKVELARAVLSDSDLTDTQLDPARTIGVDMRGTVHGLGSG